MNIIKDLNDLPPNIFGFSPESLSLAEENTYLGKAIIELQNIIDNLGLKCSLVPNRLTNSIGIMNIKEKEFETLIQKFGADNYTSYSFEKPFSFIYLDIPIQGV